MASITLKDELNYGDLERWSKAARKICLESSLEGKDLEVLEDLPLMEYWGAMLKAAIRAEWVIDPKDVSESDLAEMSFGEVRETARAVMQLLNDTLAVDPT